MRVGIFWIVLMVLFSVTTASCQEGAVAPSDSLVIAFTRPEDQYYGKLQRMLYTEIFRRLAMQAEFRHYPAKRASAEADAGNVDGEAGRIAAYAADHPNLIRIEEYLIAPNFSAFTAKDTIPPLNGWESLKGTPYTVAYMRGSRICEINLPKVIGRENIFDITEPVQALKKLLSGRADLFVEDELTVLNWLQTPEFKASKIRLVGVMECAPLYPYLHKRHTALASKIAEIIRAVKTEGLIEQYRIILDKEFSEK